MEDEAGDILLMRQALMDEPFPVRIRVAVDGEQAMHLLAQEMFEPDVVILDLNLPQLSGLAVLQRSPPEVPVVVFTSSSNPRDRQRSLQLGAKEYVQKPTDLTQYVEQFCRIVRQWAWDRTRDS